ncbi:hypothetical protein P3X46_003426 [Hevea brasiliensis]|uniref:GTD-binding domain-containing protein n=1 Tax=Hevea brasiliensis TaxID=3981 RepID=A0ABQ9N7X5_HEVBR|nr:myosin-binding protein 1 [Hevea brasiliensis]KAJ9188025.1 hypothetical protein P3X46_003426 [Hevea brasiliensis]
MILVEMAANVTSFVEAWKNLQGLMNVLNYAACELFLNFLLLINAVFSYLLTKFAHHCKLQIPCILCSRLDHLLGNEKPGFYRNLLCSNHRSEVSSLFSCHIHGKLADGCGMCEECLLSFTMKNKSYPDMHRLLMGKFGYDLNGYRCQSSLLNREFVPGSVGVMLCACCNKPWRSRPNADKLFLLKSTSGMTMPSISRPRLLTRQEGLTKMRKRFYQSAASCHPRKTVFDPLSHAGYMELKFASASDSESQFSDDDEGCNIFPEIKEPREESEIQHASCIVPNILTNCMAPNELTYNSYKPQMQLEVREFQDVKCFQYDSNIGRGLGDLNCQQADQKTYPSVPELISLDDFPPLSNGMEASVAVLKEKCELKFPPPENSDPSALSELMSLVDAPSSFNAVEGTFEASQWKSVGTGTDNIRNISFNKHGELFKSVAATVEGSAKNDQVANEVPNINPTYMNQSDVWKSTVSDKENESSGFVAEKSTLKEPERVDEDMKLLPIENTSAQGFGLSSDKTIPGTQGHKVELHINDASRSDVVWMLQDKVPIGRTESSGLESLDGSLVSEIEGENIVDRLNRQIEYDRRCINALYKELDEERSAAAIAANQAMAMITRLQEEKAALHMEALQYLRMMEEQAEHDVEALEKANDLLAEKEKDIQDLEADLEFFRLNFPDEPVETIPAESYGLKAKNLILDDTSIWHATDIVNASPTSIFMEVTNDQENSIDVRSSWSEFEEEKLFISQCLKDLERKICQFAQQEASTDMSDSHFNKTVDRGVNKGESLEMEETQINGEMIEKSLSVHKDVPVSNGSLPAYEKSNASIDEDQITENEKNHLQFSNGQKFSEQYKEIDLFTLENEISDLNERLEALERDWNFVEHTFNSLQTGKEGLKYVQEIAHQLQELRKTARNRRQSLP